MIDPERSVLPVLEVKAQEFSVTLYMVTDSGEIKMCIIIIYTCTCIHANFLVCCCFSLRIAKAHESMGFLHVPGIKINLYTCKLSLILLVFRLFLLIC